MELEKQLEFDFVKQIDKEYDNYRRREVNMMKPIVAATSVVVGGFGAYCTLLYIVDKPFLLDIVDKLF